MNRKKVLITGAASGIGRATAIRFAAEGYDVCLNDIQPEKLRALLNELSPGDHLVVEGSYADKTVIAKAGKLIIEKWNRLDVLVNCAGLFNKTDPVAMNSVETRRCLNVR